MNKIIKTEVFIGIILIIAIIMGGIIWLENRNKFKFSEYSPIVPIEKIIKNSKFSKEEVEAIIKSMNEQKSVNRDDIVSVERINENKARVSTCTQPCDHHGSIYEANKVDGNWIIKETSSMWISSRIGAEII